MENARAAALSFGQFLGGIWTALVWAGMVALAGYVMGFPPTAPAGQIDLTDFAFLGALTACGRMAGRTKKVTQTRIIKLDQYGREFVDAEFEVRA